MKFEVPFVLMRSPIRSISEHNNMPDVFPIEFKEGIYLSSVDLFSEMDRRSQLKQKDKDKLDRSLLKYWLRTCSRSTPFGTYAGSALLSFTNDPSEIILSSPEKHNRCLRLDMNVVVEIINYITQIREIREQIKYFPNNSLYETSTSFRYAEYIVIAGARKYTLTSVEKTSYLESILRMAGNGILITDIVQYLIALENVEEEQARRYVDNLINSQILYSELEPAVTGNDPFTTLVAYLKELKIDHEVISNIIQIGQVLSLPYGGIRHLNELQLLIKNVGFEIKSVNLFQVDMFMATERNAINIDLVNRIVNQANDLKYLSRPLQMEALENFITKFTSKYNQAEVPLNIVLDADLGVGYGDIDSQVGNTQLVDDLPIISMGGRDRIKHDHINHLVSTKYLSFLASPTDAIRITEEDLYTLRESTKANLFPNSMYLIGSLLKNGNSGDLNDFTFDLNGFSGPSAANLLGRFTHGNAELFERTKKLLEEEEKQNPDCIYAEIVHLPQARTGNVVIRPLLRKYEIPYVGVSGIASENQIPLSDILVSIKNGKVCLRSKANNKQIIPRLTSAHNFTSNALPAYKFLGDLQLQGLAAPNFWDWGIFVDSKFLPRVIYKNIIIKKAQWQIDEKELNKDYKENNIKEFRRKFNIPRLVVFAENDNELLIDFESTGGSILFQYLMEKHKALIVHEFLFDENNCFVTDSFGAPYCNQVVIPISYEIQKAIAPSLRSSIDLVKRSFFPGSEWNYYKLYCGSNTADKLLTKFILPFIQSGLRDSLFEKFHFVRYRDEFSHLRIRFFNTNLEKQQKLNSLFLQQCEIYHTTGLINKLTIDTYERELERYDANLIELAEELFSNDSYACLRFLDLLDDSEDGNKYRMLFSIRGIDMLLMDFGLDASQRHTIAKNIQQSFFAEFGGTPVLQKVLNAKYRQYQASIFSHLNHSNDEINEVVEAVSVFQHRSKMNKAVIDEIKFKVLENNILIDELLYSLIHMFMNRMFLTKNRAFELVIYHFLEKYYGSQIAMSKNKSLELVE